MKNETLLNTINSTDISDKRSVDSKLYASDQKV